jgi:hypothetical protein
LAAFTVGIDECENIICWYHRHALLTAHGIINGEDISHHILKHDWLGTNDTTDKDGIQQACFS